jgi:VanZ family protein
MRRRERERKRERERERWYRVAVTSGVVFLAAVVPATRRETPRPPPYNIDKVAHSLGHAGVAATLFDALDRDDSGERSRRAALAAAVGSTAYGVGLELCQRWVPGRRYEHGDVVAGALGSLVGAGVAWLRANRSDG